MWVIFIVRNLDRKLLRSIRRDATRNKCSLSESMRKILCDHYSLDCPPTGAPSRLEHGSSTQCLRLHTALWQALKDDSAETGVSMQRLVHEALEARYVTEEAA
jgi:hypothetical protein